MTELLKGRKISKQLYKQFRETSEHYRGRSIELKAVIVTAGEDPASETYSQMIEKNCKKAGMTAEIRKYGKEITSSDLKCKIFSLNSDDSVHGIIVMLPLWAHIDEDEITSSISPDKDIDGVNPINAGRIFTGRDAFIPNTAQACIDILNGYGIELPGKHVVIVGRSNIVGKPLAGLLLRKGTDATVTVCHSRTKNIAEICRRADILVAAAGRPGMITAEFTNPGMVIVDVGMNEVDDGNSGTKLAGDVDAESVTGKVKAFTPVPGGMSPLTNTALIKNIIKAAQIQHGK